MNAIDATHLDGPELQNHVPHHPKMPSAEAVATSRDPHHWGRAMAVAISKLADQLESDEGHEALMGRDLGLRITEEPEGVRITLWCLPGE